MNLVCLNKDFTAFQGKGAYHIRKKREEISGILKPPILLSSERKYSLGGTR